MNYEEIKSGIRRFRLLVAEKKYSEADALVKKLTRGGMTVHDFQSNTTRLDRATMLKWRKKQGLQGLGRVNQPDYTHYVVVWKEDKRRAKIDSGWSFPEDAKERQVEILDVESEGTGPYQDANAKVITKRGLRTYGLDADNDGDWYRQGEALGALSATRRELQRGSRVRIGHGSGVASGKTGVVVSPTEIRTDGRGVPTNVAYNAYRPVDWSKEVAVRLDDGSLTTMFMNRLTVIG